MLIECKGIKTDTFYLPPFTLNKGELVVLYLYGGRHFYNLSMWLKDIFTGQIRHEHVIINTPLSFVEHFKESSFRKHFYPTTVKEFTKKNANEKSEFSQKIYGINDITSKTKVKNLICGQQKLLSLYSTLSKTNNITFDLVGVVQDVAENIYPIINETVSNGGAAILLDNVDVLKNNCTKYIEIEWLKE